MKKIPLTRGKFAVVDDEDFTWITLWKWSFDGLYAIRMHRLDSGYKKIYMHREINQTPDGMETDHINHDKLDNRRANLRSVTKGQNNRSRQAYKNNETGILGVHWYPNLGKYRARITVDGKIINLGYFTKIENAVAARKKAEECYAI